MAPPSVVENMTLVDIMDGGGNLFVAPTIESANTASDYRDDQSSTGFDTTTDITGLYGGQVALATASFDFTQRQYIWFQLSYEQFGSPGNYDTLANGGLRIGFIDSLGNFSRFNVMGSDVFAGSNVFGAYNAFRNAGSTSTSENGSVFVIDRTRTPDNESGTAIDWTDVDDLYAAINASSSDRVDCFVGRLRLADRPGLLNGENGNPCNLQVLANYQGSWADDGDTARLFRGSLVDQIGARGISYLVLYGYDIGDGVAATRYEENGVNIGFYPSRDAQAVAPAGIEGYGAAFNGDGSVGHGREIVVNQTASCYFSVTRSSFSGVAFSTGEGILRITGSASAIAEASIVEFLNLTLVECNHLQMTNCVYTTLKDLEITSSTGLVGGIYRSTNEYAKGLIIDDVAGDYSAIDCRFNDDNTGIDVTVGGSGAGTYNLSGLSVQNGHVLKVHNPSITNAVTVYLSPGLSAQAVDLWFNYDNEASGPFTAGETLTFGNGATAELVVLQDEGTTGTMYCELLTGSVPPDNNSITGGTSSATANVNEAGGANNSDLTINNDLTVNLTVTVTDNTGGAAIQNARVRLEAAAGGPETIGAVLLEGLTNASGVLTTTYTYTSDQPVIGTVRKSSPGDTLYKPGPLSGSITSSGYNVPIVLVRD